MGQSYHKGEKTPYFFNAGLIKKIKDFTMTSIVNNGRTFENQSLLRFIILFITFNIIYYEQHCW